MKHSIVQLVKVGLMMVCFFLAPQVTYAKESFCITPKVTQTFLLEMQAYNKVVRDLLQEKGCMLPKMTVFGYDVASISPKQNQVTEAFWNTYSDKAIDEIQMSLNASNNRTSALLLRDIELVKEELSKMRVLLNNSTDTCMSINVRDMMDTSTEIIPLYLDIQARYIAYRQLYLWMMQSDQITVSFPNTTKDTVKSVSETILQRYTTATRGQNPFSYIKDYKDASLTSCQSQELGFDEISNSLQGLSDAVLGMGQTATEFGEAVSSLSTITLNLNDLLGQVRLRGPDGSTIISGKGVQMGEEKSFANNILEGVFGIPLNEFMEATKKIATLGDNLRLNGAPVKEYTFADLQNQVVQIDATTGKITRKSLTDIPVTYLQQASSVDIQKEEALQQYMAKNYDTLGKYETTQYFLGKMDQMAQTLSEVNNAVSSSADDFTFVCQTHLHRNNDDCGELKK